MTSACTVVGTLNNTARGAFALACVYTRSKYFGCRALLHLSLIYVLTSLHRQKIKTSQKESSHLFRDNNLTFDEFKMLLIYIGLSENVLATVSYHTCQNKTKN